MTLYIVRVKLVFQIIFLKCILVKHNMARVIIVLHKLDRSNGRTSITKHCLTSWAQIEHQAWRDITEGEYTESID